MSPLGQASTSSVGRPDPSRKLSWSDFVRHVLELTVKAYRAMCKERVARRDWEENTFTIQLGENYIRPVAFDDDYPLRISIRTKVHTEQMKNGTQATIEAKEIDLYLYDVWERDYLRKHFVWEAKLVGDKRVARKYQKLNSEYVNEAIYRFIRKDYAEGLDNAGILGYVLDGQTSNIVGDINNSMGRIRKNPPLPKSNQLRPTQAINDFEDVYLSCHKRTDSTKIELHHLFLTFSFI